MEITKDNQDINLAISKYRSYFDKIDFSRGSKVDEELVLELLNV